MKLRLCFSTIALAIMTTAAAVAAPTSGFSDVPSNHWAAKSVADLKAKGIVSTKDGAKFQGDQYLTRYEAAVYLDRIVHYIEAAHKPLHAITLPTAQMPVIAPGPAQKVLVELIKNRYIAANSPLAQAPSTAPVTHSEMVAATAQVITQIESRRSPAPDPDMDEE